MVQADCPRLQEAGVPGWARLAHTSLPGLHHWGGQGPPRTGGKQGWGFRPRKCFSLLLLGWPPLPCVPHQGRTEGALIAWPNTQGHRGQTQSHLWKA